MIIETAEVIVNSVDRYFVARAPADELKMPIEFAAAKAAQQFS